MTKGAGASPPSRPRADPSVAFNLAGMAFQVKPSSQVDSLSGQEGGLAPAGFIWVQRLVGLRRVDCGVAVGR